MAKHTFSTQRGFTLIEMVMTIVLIGIIAAVIAPVLSTTIGGFHAARVRNDLTAQARLVLERLTREIREADPAGITVNPAGTSLTFTQLSGLVGLVDTGGIMARTYNGCNAVQVSAAGNVLNWDDDAANLISPVSALTTNLAAITFSYSPGTLINSGVVTIDLTLSDGNEAITAYREIHIRNTQGTVVCVP